MKQKLLSILACIMLITTLMAFLPHTPTKFTPHTVNAAETYTLVKDVSTLAVGDKIVIVAYDENKALSKNQKSNNRENTDIEKGIDRVTLNENVQVIILEEGTVNGTFAFNVGVNAEGYISYLYAASSSNNYLRTKGSKDSKGNSNWEISITSDGIATIKAKGDFTRNWLRHNSSSNIFSCYSTGQADICIYKNAIISRNIAYNLNGGENQADAPTTYEEGVGLNELPTPTREGYNFLGWELNNERVTEISALQTGDVTLVAVWGKQASEYTVAFDSNGGSAVESVTVAAGETFTKPNDPTKSGYTFMGWFNGESEWNFETDTVNTNLTLTASWKDSNIIAIENNINNVDAYMNLGYKYSMVNNQKVKSVNLLKPTSTTFTGVVAVDDIPNGETTEVSEHFDIEDEDKTVDNNLFIINVIRNDRGNVYIKPTEIRLYATSSFEISSKYNNVIISSCRAVDNSGATVSDAICNVVDGKATFFATSTIKYVAGFEITLENEVEIELLSKSYTDVDFRIGCAVENDFGDIANIEGAEYGIKVTCGEKDEYFATTDSLVENLVEQNLFNVVISLGDAINNRERLSLTFTVCAYVKYDGVTYTSTLVKSFSVVDMVIEYNGKEATQSVVAGLYNMLVNLGLIAE